MKKILILLPMIMLGCSSAVHINLNDLDSYTNEANSKAPFKAPYLSYFKKGDMSLTFVAVKHFEGDDNPTCETIRDEFKKNHYNFLLVEGMPFSQINEESEIGYAKDCEKKNYKNCGEDACAVNEAVKMNISFNYAEPSDQTIKAEMLKKGYTGEELMFFYGLRQIPQLKRQSFNDADTLKNKTADYLARNSLKRLKLNSVFTITDFEKMYFSKFNKNLDYLNFDPDLVSPRVDDNPAWTNIISHEVGVVREEFLVKMIEDRVNTYKKVMVVYGSGHLVEARRALEKSFSSVRNIKTY